MTRAGFGEGTHTQLWIERCKFGGDKVAAGVLNVFFCILCSSLLLKYVGDELCGRFYALCLYSV
jgi:hypothetical protein